MKLESRKLRFTLVVAALACVGLAIFLGPAIVKKANAKKLIAEQLIDPSSAQFRNLKVSPDGAVVCGEMNGKNQFGAYVGFQKFWVRNGENGRLEPSSDTNPFDQLTWAHQWGLCSGIDLVGSLRK